MKFDIFLDFLEYFLNSLEINFFLKENKEINKKKREALSLSCSLTFFLCTSPSLGLIVIVREGSIVASSFFFSPLSPSSLSPSLHHTNTHACKRERTEEREKKNLLLSLSPPRDENVCHVILSRSHSPHTHLLCSSRLPLLFSRFLTERVCEVIEYTQTHVKKLPNKF